MLIVRSIVVYPSGEIYCSEQKIIREKIKQKNHTAKKVQSENLQDVHNSVSLIQQEGIRQSRDSILFCEAKNLYNRFLSKMFYKTFL